MYIVDSMENLYFKLIRTPSLDLSLALIMGVVTARYFDFSFTALLVLLLLTPLLLHFSKMPEKFRLFPLLFCLAGFALLLHSEKVTEMKSDISHLAPSGKINVSGLVAGGFKYFPGGYRFNLRADSVERPEGKKAVTGLLKVSVYKGTNPPLPGDSLLLKGVKIKPIISFRNIGGFDYEAFMRDKGIAVKTGISQENMIERLSSHYRYSPISIGERLRRFAKSYIEKRFPSGLAPIAEAMTIGITGAVSPEVRHEFAVSGLAHLLAISGLHVGFVSAFAYYIFYGVLFLVAFKMKPNLVLAGKLRKPAFLLALFAGLVFVLSTGTRVSAVRAGIMVAVYLFSLMAGREKEPLNALAFSAILILLFDPASLFSASFQMSYIAVLSIIVLFAKDDEKDDFEKLKKLTFKKRILDSIISTIKVSICIGFAVAPVVIKYFSQVHFGGFLANVIALPFASLAVPLTITGAFLDSFSGVLSSIATYPAIFCFWVISETAKFFSHFHLMSFSGPPLPIPLLIFYYTVFLLFIFGSKYKKAGAIVLAVGLILYYIEPSRSYTEVRFIDVGQGDATLIRLKTGENILVDGGRLFGSFDIGEMVLVPLLHRLKVRHLDAVIATHGDIDHAGGLLAVMKRIKVEHYFDNGQKLHRKMLDELWDVAEKKSIPVAVLKGGDIVAGSGGALKVFHPDAKFAAEHQYGKDNSLSLGMILNTGYGRVFLAGDMEKEAEKHLVGKLLYIKSDILKIGHHGSNTSSHRDFLLAVNPKIGIISAGRYGRYHYPAKQVVKRMKKLSVKLISTMDEGEIVFRFLKSGVEQKSFVHPTWKKAY